MPLVFREQKRRKDIIMAQLVRPRKGKMIAGVCAGLADRFDISTRWVRLGFVVSCILPGPQFILYVALWILIPKEDAWA